MAKTILVIAVTILIFTGGCLFPQSTPQSEEPAIDTSQEPVQGPYSGEAIYEQIEGYKITIMPLKTYKTAVVVIGKKFYSDPEAELVPVDLCVVWGILAEPEYLQYIICTQTDRKCKIEGIERVNLSISYIEDHFTNLHIIPANETIYEAIRDIKIHQPIILEGFLVDVYIDGEIWLETSLSPTDTGTGACEILYVTKVRIDTTVYE